MVLDEPAVVAFLDHRPLFPGHVLVVPRVHVERLADLPATFGPPLLAAVQRFSRAVPEAVDGHGAFVAVNDGVSQSVPHLHVHVVPRRHKDGLRGFFWPRQRYESDEQMAAVAAAIRARLAPGSPTSSV